MTLALQFFSFLFLFFQEASPAVSNPPPTTDQIKLGLWVGWILTIFLGLLCTTIIVYIWIGRINLNKLISESGGDASLARFQLLVFTFVITLSMFYIVVHQTPPQKFPEIPAEILGLLGISGGTYALGKGIKSDANTATASTTTTTTTSQPTKPPIPATQPVLPVMPPVPPVPPVVPPVEEET